ncbi:MAG: thymidylate synthase [Planctomycetota bacterium]
MKGMPVLTARGLGLAEAWENSLIVLHERGGRIRTMYDKPEDPPSYDATMLITVEEPLAEPRIHQDFPGGLEDLEEYVMEVCDGIKDHLVRDPRDPHDTRWEYTYHGRLAAYTAPGLSQGAIDQLERIAQKLAQTPYTRRAQAVTWKAWEDLDCYDPPCLQSLWCRVTEEEGFPHLGMNVRFRSNDAYKAAFMNMFALVRLQERIAERLGELSGREVRLGRYVHFADSYHLYGSYFREFEERFLGGLKRRDFSERTLRYEDVKPIMDEAHAAILEKVRALDRS